MAVISYVEMHGDESPASLTLSLESGVMTRLYQMGPDTKGGQVFAVDMVDTLRSILGFVDVAVQPNGTVKRTLPVFDPFFTYWPATKVGPFKGVSPLGPSSKASPRQDAKDNTGAMTVEAWVNYNNWKFTVEFSAKNYNLFTDDKLYQVTTDPDGADMTRWTLSDGATVVQLRAYNEWDRFTIIHPPRSQNSWVKSANAQMQFFTGSGNAPNKFPFTGESKMYMPDDIVTITLLAVPYRWVTSHKSYFNALKSTVNYFGLFEDDNTGASVFPAGSLQYMDFQAGEPYTLPYASFLEGRSRINRPPRLVNVDLVCQRTRRVCSDPPALTNPNHLAAVNGWRTQPWLGGVRAGALGILIPLPGARRFYWASAGVNGEPAWAAAPHQLLWCDPDQPAVLGGAALPSVL